VDGLTCRDYEQHLERNLEDLHARVRPQNGEGAWPDRSAGTASRRRRGDRVDRLCRLLATFQT
jgi:hypothetical protein